MRNLLLIILVLGLLGCKQEPGNSQGGSTLRSDVRSVSQKVIMDYYNQRGVWPDSTDGLVEFCLENSSKYPSNTLEICRALKVHALKDGTLYIESKQDSNESDAMHETVMNVLSKRIDPNNIKNIYWCTSMVLSTTGRFLEESEIDRTILPLRGPVQ